MILPKLTLFKIWQGGRKYWKLFYQIVLTHRFYRVTQQVWDFNEVSFVWETRYFS